MKKFIELINSSANYCNEHKDEFRHSLRGIMSSAKPFDPRSVENLDNVKESFVGHYKNEDWAIAIYKDDKWYSIYIPRGWGHISYTIDKYAWYEIFGLGWTVKTLNTKQVEKIWNIIKDCLFDNNIKDEDEYFSNYF